MNTEIIKNSLEHHSLATPFLGTIEYHSPLSKVSYYRIGGPATAVLTPRSFQDLEIIHQVILDTKARFFILGWGSNLLFSDQGFDGIVIRMKHLFSQIEMKENNELKVGASVGCSSLLKFAQEKGLGGLSHLTGIPGSVGGMIAMNAGTHLGEIVKCCKRVRTVRLGVPGPLLISEHEVNESHFSYRKNKFLKSGELIISCDLVYTPEDPAKVRSEIDELYQRRKQTQPVDFPSCGSVFMNPRGTGKNAWQVIDLLGLRGHKVGDAQISEKHSNFIINLGHATAADVKALIQLVKERAKAELGIELHEEVKIIE